MINKYLHQYIMCNIQNINYIYQHWYLHIQKFLLLSLLYYKCLYLYNSSLLDKCRKLEKSFILYRNHLRKKCYLYLNKYCQDSLIIYIQKMCIPHNFLKIFVNRQDYKIMLLNLNQNSLYKNHIKFGKYLRDQHDKFHIHMDK